MRSAMTKRNMSKPRDRYPLLTMRFTYPLFRPEDHPSDEQTALRIARHSPCTVCVDCSGLRPSPDDELVDDLPVTSIGGLGQYGSDDEDDDPYLDTCSCGHGVTTHGADLLLLGREEFARLGRVASRLDELLQVSMWLAR